MRGGVRRAAAPAARAWSGARCASAAAAPVHESTASRRRREAGMFWHVSKPHASALQRSDTPHHMKSSKCNEFAT
eukprot:4875293-Prymnesium_polylepis.1